MDLLIHAYILFYFNLERILLTLNSLYSVIGPSYTEYDFLWLIKSKSPGVITAKFDLTFIFAICNKLYTKLLQIWDKLLAGARIILLNNMENKERILYDVDD